MRGGKVIERQPAAQYTDINLPYFAHSLHHFTLRYADPGNALAGYVADAGKCAAALLLCVLHFWHCRRSIVERHPATTVRPRSANARRRPKVSTMYTLDVKCMEVGDCRWVGRLFN